MPQINKRILQPNYQKHYQKSRGKEFKEFLNNNNFSNRQQHKLLTLLEAKAKLLDIKLNWEHYVCQRKTIIRILTETKCFQSFINKAEKLISVDDAVGFYDYFSSDIDEQIKELSITAEQLTLLTETDPTKGFGRRVKSK
jgi:hypothetical protein